MDLGSFWIFLLGILILGFLTYLILLTLLVLLLSLSNVVLSLLWWVCTLFLFSENRKDLGFECQNGATLEILFIDCEYWLSHVYYHIYYVKHGLIVNRKNLYLFYKLSWYLWGVIFLFYWSCFHGAFSMRDRRADLRLIELITFSLYISIMRSR